MAYVRHLSNLEVRLSDDCVGLTANSIFIVNQKFQPDLLHKIEKLAERGIKFFATKDGYEMCRLAEGRTRFLEINVMSRLL